jgi:hypothetical protein
VKNKFRVDTGKAEKLLDRGGNRTPDFIGLLVQRSTPKVSGSISIAAKQFLAFF